MCGHVFVLLDHAEDEMEASRLRDRLEEARAEKARGVTGGVTGVYEVTPSEEEKREEETVGAGEEMKGVSPSSDEVEKGAGVPEEGDERGEEVSYERGEEEKAEEVPAEVEMPGVEGGVSQEEETSEKEEIPQEEVSVEVFGEESETPSEEVPEKEELEPEGETEEAGDKEEEDEEGMGDVVLQPDEEKLEGEEEEPRAEEVKEDSHKEGKGGIGEEELPDAYEPLVPPKRRISLFPILVVVLIVVVLAGGGWYLYQWGQFSSTGGIIGSIVEKINAIRGESSFVLFDIKNEQEPALNGKFFSVRGMVQNKKKTAVPWVSLRIKIFDAKNNVVLTGTTVAGRVLKPEEISKMTVQDVMKQYRSMNAMNRKVSGRLEAGKKLPFLFLFDLSKFPRSRAKTFQVEVIQTRK